MTRILFCGEGHGAVAALTSLINFGFKPDVLTVDNDLKLIAKNNKLIIKTKMNSWIENESDIIFSAAHREIIPNDIINKVKVVNIHYALLPKYRGLHSIVWAILNGEKDVGWTFHEMDERMDGGPIIYQESVCVGSKTSWELMLEIDNIVKIKAGLVFQKYLEKQLMPINQDETKALFVAKRNEKDCQIDWDKWDVVFLKRAFQALVEPYPIPYFIYKNKKYEVVKYKIYERDYLETPGRVVYRDFDSIWIKVIGGLLQVYQVKCEEFILNPLAIFKNTGARLKWV